MNHVEEQKNELEALSEIYYNEIELKSSQPPISFSISIRPQASYYEQPEMTGDEDGDDDSSESDDGGESGERLQCPAVKMMFELPATYPETKPSMRVLDSQNLEDYEIEALLSNLEKTCERSLGSVMIFELVSEVVEWLSSKAEREANEAAREQAKRIEALEAEERKKCDGTTVTVESFLAWKAKFDAELLRQKLQQQMSQADQSQGGQKRLTGREMFETDKALAESDLNFVDELEQEQLEALMQSINEAELDDDDDDDDLEDDDDDDDEDISGESLSGEEESDDD